MAHEVSAAYIDAPRRRDPLGGVAYAQLVAETDPIFRRITSPDRPDPVRVFFTMCPTPNANAEEIIGSVRNEQLVEVTIVATDADRRHLLMDSEMGGAYDRFRGCPRRPGPRLAGARLRSRREFAVWLSQERFHTPLARRALATELHGQHSVRWTTGEIAEPKGVLFDQRSCARTRRRDEAPLPTLPLRGVRAGQAARQP
jgi:hypothetical protein